MKKVNKTWYYYGKGMDDFGLSGSAQDSLLLTPKDDEILARVDAVAICASDIKMINMGNDYPLFKDRDFISNPAVLGHELSLTIEVVGKNLQNIYKKGMRIGVQPDVYMKEVRYCIGVNVEGGFQKYMLLGTSVFHSDHGVTVFPVTDEVSYASVAQLEPNACVEASYRPFCRNAFHAEKKLLVYIDDTVKKEFLIDQKIVNEHVFVIGKREGLFEKAKVLDGVKEIKKYFPGGIEDLLIIGDVPENILELLISMLAHDSVCCWLQETPHDMNVLCDIAKIHYSKINFLGTSTRVMSDAFALSKQRYEYVPHGSLLVMGGAGAMGRMHTLRALMDPQGPNTIVVSARSFKRLEVLLKDFEEIAYKNRKKLLGVATNEGDWIAKIKKIAPCGFDDIVVSAPGIDPVEKSVAFLKKGGMLILFSGTKYGSLTKLPIGSISSKNYRINASSGSNVEDELHVLQNIQKGKLDPNKNVVGIVGFHAIKEALIAVSAGDFPGKVIIYPQLDDLKLTHMEELQYEKTQLGEYVLKNGWNRQAEKLLYEQYEKKGEIKYE